MPCETHDWQGAHWKNASLQSEDYNALQIEFCTECGLLKLAPSSLTLLRETYEFQIQERKNAVV